MIIHVNVRPNSKEEYIEQTGESEFLVHLKEEAEKGKANARLINILSKKFEVSYKNVVIKNPTSRKKIVEIKRG